MNTGLDSFSNPEDIGALYPFVGIEVALVVIAFALWIAWHVAQTKEENREYVKALELYEQIGLERAMRHGGGAHIDHGEPAVRTAPEGPARRAGPSPRRRREETARGSGAPSAPSLTHRAGPLPRKGGQSRSSKGVRAMYSARLSRSGSSPSGARMAASRAAISRRLSLATALATTTARLVASPRSMS